MKKEPFSEGIKPFYTELYQLFMPKNPNEIIFPNFVFLINYKISGLNLSENE